MIRGMVRALHLLALAALPAGSAQAQSVVIDTPAEARGWIDATFAAHGCRMARAAFFDRMAADGVIQTDADRAFAMAGTEKILRGRRVLSELKALFDAGLICEDPADPTIAISKFGGCA
ncbi:MAG: hypothetical protein D6811_11505 [Alphaproteobacteria bacterium]|nr:MAG: hypothetical protein D6811_11505 [Alphaproteobacteria bacterium]